MEGEELVELGEAFAAVVVREADPGLRPAGGTGEEVTGAAVVDIADPRLLLLWLLLLLLTRSAIRWTLPPTPPPAAATC